MLTIRDASSSSIGTCLRSSAGNTGSPDVTAYRGGCHLDRSGRPHTLAWHRPDGASNGVRARPQADDLIYTKDRQSLQYDGPADRRSRGREVTILEAGLTVWWSFRAT